MKDVISQAERGSRLRHDLVCEFLIQPIRKEYPTGEAALSSPSKRRSICAIKSSVTNFDDRCLFISPELFI